MFCVNDALERFLRTYSKIQLSGIINEIDFIYINCVGKNKHIYSQKIYNLPKVNINIGDHHKDESETLNILRNFAIANPIGNSLYLHSKGASKQKSHKFNSIPKKEYEYNVQTWIDCMEYFLIEDYKNCLKILESYDNCGIFFVNPNHNKSAYAGNFWWATNKYLSTLNKCSKISRHRAEYRFLIPHLSNYKELYSNYKNFMYKYPIHRNLYTKQPSLL